MVAQMVSAQCTQKITFGDLPPTPLSTVESPRRNLSLSVGGGDATETPPYKAAKPLALNSYGRPMPEWPQFYMGSSDSPTAPRFSKRGGSQHSGNGVYEPDIRLALRHLDL